MVKIPNTFGLTVTAKRLIKWPSQQALFKPDESFIIVGAGSNLLFVDAEFDGQLIQLEQDEFIIEQTASDYLVTLGAGLNWHQTVKRLIDAGIDGLENLALIPGTVGAAPVQNIGAYGVEFSQLCESVTGYNLQTQQVETLNNQQCQFAYRESVFKKQLKDKFIITQVTLRLTKNWQANLSYGPLAELNNPTAIQIFEQVCLIRQSKLPDPAKLPNAGSFFKNPVVEASVFNQLIKQDPNIPNYPQADGKVKLAAGYLIDKAGLKGAVYQNAKVHQQQALVLVNQGGSCGVEIANLAAMVRQTVLALFKVKLNPEVRFIGKQGEVDSAQFLDLLIAENKK
ncbi:UDP-N-acetylmuramate dehydrogenase [Catenovulum sp. 2E275]|uniref:UDP-N-acetylmuramate dehydrogenase n=1 Tax=Catenovulum sp. 2E275 TaxID=2980497 RepID=UPI0021CE9D1E|nr:UDP-N-acetylmuramate dehydrogenase [Catenovulum sp. 2E275]MCU4677171.1 UDP-N-acetylmuramate dehydrogenase [Catenovulum sp. 2E275]